MARSFQPAFFDFTPRAGPASIGERLRDLAFIANAGSTETACMVTQVAERAWDKDGAPCGYHGRER